MNFLTEKAFECSRTGIFAYSDVLVWLGENRNSVRNLVKRAIAGGEIVHIRRGLYCLGVKYRRHPLDRRALAALIYGPGYISMETALAIHGWIPEAVHAVLSVSAGRARSFETPLGFFDYVQVRQNPLYAGVERRECETPGQSFLVAKPLKALADCVASRGLDWHGIEPLAESLRVEEEELGTLKTGDFEELDGIYKSRRARVFLEGLRKELGL